MVELAGSKITRINHAVVIKVTTSSHHSLRGKRISPPSSFPKCFSTPCDVPAAHEIPGVEPPVSPKLFRNVCIVNTGDSEKTPFFHLQLDRLYTAWVSGIR